MPGSLLCALGGQRRHSRLQLPREMEEGTRSEGGSGTPRLLQSRLGKGPEAGSWTVFSGPCLLLAGHKDRGCARSTDTARLGSGVGEGRQLHGGCWHRPGVSMWVSGRANSPASDAVR